MSTKRLIASNTVLCFTLTTFTENGLQQLVSDQYDPHIEHPSFYMVSGLRILAVWC